jgi:putative protein kinase ArgK-like GTPase of G3E family
MAENLRDALALRGGDAARVPVLLVEATTGRGIDELMPVLEERAAAASERAGERRRRAIRARLLSLIADTVTTGIEERLDDRIEEATAAVVDGKTSPERAAAELMAAFLESAARSGAKTGGGGPHGRA